MCEGDGMEEWKECKLGDICKSNINSYSEKDNWTFVNYLDTGNITENKISDIQFIDLSSESLPSRARRKVQINDIIYSTVRPNQKHFGIIKNQPENFLVSTGFAVLHINTTIADPNFIFYNLIQNENTESLHAIAEQTTSAYPAIKPSDIENLSIKLPSLPTQQKIARILSSLDDKIELNNKINTNLEQQAQALFKNFSEKSSKSVKFTDLIYILGGGTPKTHNEDYWNGNIPFFTPKDVGNPYCLLTEKTITESGLDNCNSRLYPVNTIFVTARGTVGKISLAGLPMAMNQSCYALKSKDDNQILAYFYTLEAINSLKHKANGATFDAIVTRDFETETINVLSEQDTKEFTQIVKPIFEMILTNQKENINLSNLRDTLLPKLMNGEIEV